MKIYLVLFSFAKLCYNLVQSGSIKKHAQLDSSREKILFPKLEVELDLSRAQTFGMMLVNQSEEEVECEFRHLSLAEYLTAIHVHTTGEPLKVSQDTFLWIVLKLKQILRALLKIERNSSSSICLVWPAPVKARTRLSFTISSPPWVLTWARETPCST